MPLTVLPCDARSFTHAFYDHGVAKQCCTRRPATLPATSVCDCGAFTIAWTTLSDRMRVA